jgi:hypothetical protein
MNVRTIERVFAKTLITMAVLAVFAPAHAQEADADALKRPDSSVRLGVGITPGNQRDRTIWGQYNGMREDSTHLLLDADIVKRDASGFWTIIRGRDLGLETRDLGITLQQQGDWRLNVDLGEIVHREIRTINSGMAGAGTVNPQIVRLATPGTGADLDFKLDRRSLALGGDKWITNNLQFEVAFKNEDKTGTRMWGRGYDCATYVCTGTQDATHQKWAVIPVPEPVNFNIRQIDAKANFTSGKLFVSGGYYGSFFTNANGNVQPTVPGSLNGPTGVLTPLNPAAGPVAGHVPTGGTSLQGVLQLPMGLYPDNQAHQFYLSGNYAWTRVTKSNFKFSYTHATQTENFAAMGFSGAPAGRDDLGGRVDTLLGQFNLNSRVSDRLNLLANVRYEKKNDASPIAAYNVQDTTFFNNSHISNTKLASKFEAGYRLPDNWRVTGGVDFERINKTLPGSDVVVGGISGLRGSTHEITYRAELRKSISETLTGALMYAHSDRGGSNWYSLANVPAQGVTYGNLYTYGQIYQRTGTFPYDVADRKRNKARASADWTPLERLSVQLVAEAARDTYDPPTQNGLRNGGMTLVSFDTAYQLTDKWKVTGYASLGDQTMSSQDRPNYVADIKDSNTTWGVGVLGKPTGVLDVGANVTRTADNTKYTLSTDPQMSAANIAQSAVGLPPVFFSDTRYSLFAKYAMTKQSDVRLDVIYVRNKLEEWAWGYAGVPFTYSDNTTVTINPQQHVSFIGGSYIYRF